MAMFHGRHWNKRYRLECVSISPKMSISSFMGYLNGKDTLMIYEKHPKLQDKWNKAFLARGYYVATIGNLTEEAIKKYIAEQSEKQRKEDRKALWGDVSHLRLKWGW